MGTEQVDDLRARVAQLEAKIEELEARDERSPRPDPEPERSVSRRRLLGMAGAATAGAVGATVLAASPAGATTGPLQFGSPNDAGTDATSLTSTAAGAATFRAANTGANNGLEGSAAAATGVYGQTASTSNAGVLGEATASGSGVVGSSASGVAIRAGISTTSSGGAHLDLIPHGTVTGPPSGFHNAGQFWMDATAALWQCVVTGTPGKWVRQAPLVLLASPFRVYDSRTGNPNPSGSPQGVLALNATRTINCTPSMPVGITVATGLLMNVTLTNTVGAKGAVTVFSAAVSAPSTSSVNWAATNTTVANAVTSACDSSQDIKVKCVSGTSTDFIVDVIGYYP
jgi:hypothetical protein